MAAEFDQIPFVLGMFSISSSPAFSALVLDNQALISIDAIKPLAASLGLALTGTNNLFELLQNWDHNFQALCATVTALDDKSRGKYFRSHFSGVEFFEPLAPFPEPRQIFNHIPQRSGVAPGGIKGQFITQTVSTLVGPKAKILLGDPAEDAKAEVKLGTIISRPTFGASATDAEASIAGYVTVTDVTRTAFYTENSTNWLAAKGHPTSLPTGPYFVPAPFAGPVAKLELALSLNGEQVQAGTGAQLSLGPIEQIIDLSQLCQLFAGDILCAGISSAKGLTDAPILGDGDIIETAISGLGRQTTNAMQSTSVTRET